jgi:hypothetical protein
MNGPRSAHRLISSIAVVAASALSRRNAGSTMTEKAK